ncbi:P-II family nitrogen regulator [Planococcus sp. SSTMD024]|uniref:P-II family nitrogen regulator n=1 Tax=Planococcus sp. SSTMD024 TaxID=3242163 RepID=UPI00351EB35C
MNLNHRLMIAIVKRGASRDVIAAAKEAGADGATVLYAEGIGRNEKPTFLGLPATHEKDVVFIAVDGEIELAVAEAISHAGKLGKSGYGLGFTIHLSQLLGVPHLTDREDDRKKKRGVEKMPEPKDFQLIVTIVNSGDSGQVVKAAAEAGAEGGTILEGRGTGVNEQKKFMNFTIDPEKDVVLTLVPSAFAEKVVASIEQAVDLDAPGKGIAFLIDVENVFGVNHSSLNP